MSKKKRLALGVLVLLVGSYSCFWLVAQIHNYYYPPVAADGASSAYNYMKYQRDLKKEEQKLEMRKNSESQEFPSSQSFDSKRIRPGETHLDYQKRLLRKYNMEHNIEMTEEEIERYLKERKNVNLN